MFHLVPAASALHPGSGLLAGLQAQFECFKAGRWGIDGPAVQAFMGGQGPGAYLRLGQAEEGGEQSVPEQPA